MKPALQTGNESWVDFTCTAIPPKTQGESCLFQFCLLFRKTCYSSLLQDPHWHLFSSALQLIKLGLLQERGKTKQKKHPLPQHSSSSAEVHPQYVLQLLRNWNSNKAPFGWRDQLFHGECNCCASCGGDHPTPCSLLGVILPAEEEIPC